MSDTPLSSNLQSIHARWAECHAKTKTYQDPWQAVNDIGDLLAALERCEERSKACDQIADGDYGWEKLQNLCVATMSVCRLRAGYEEAVALVRRYFWCESKPEGRRIDADAMKFLDANGGREKTDRAAVETDAEHGS